MTDRAETDTEDTGQSGEVDRLGRQMDRSETFRAAYALVRSLAWDTQPDVMDVVRVAEFLSAEW